VHRFVGRKVALAVVSLLLAASMGGGFLLLPALVPLHIWAARRSGPLGRWLWSGLPVMTAAMTTWALVYVAAGEVRPWIWLGPLIAATGAAFGAAKLTSSAPRTSTPAR
jgi:hypothetical protein